MKRGIKIPGVLISQEAREEYLSIMQDFYERKERFYSAPALLGHSLGRFCEGGAEAGALEAALRIQDSIRFQVEKPTEEDRRRFGLS
jgi:hypothetical protein